jgi:hypothetical protein
MPKFRCLTDQEFIVIGRRHGSEDVALEAGEVEARWRRFVDGLAAYGFGKADLEAFVALLAEHAKLRGARPEAVTDKKLSVVSRNQQVAAGWAWVGRVKAVLGRLGRTDQAVATGLNAAMPDDDAALEAGIRALAAVLTENQGRLAADAQVAQRLAEVATLSAGLLASPGAVHTSKLQTVADTAQVDLLDGKLCVMMADLNAAGRAAVRNGDLAANTGDFTFHHLKGGGRTSVQAAPAATPAKPSPQAAT